MLLLLPLMSFSAVFALIPVIIILILIAAAAGLNRGTDLFALMGFGTLIGVAQGGRAGGTGKGLRGQTRFSQTVSRTTGRAAGMVKSAKSFSKQMRTNKGVKLEEGRRKDYVSRTGKTGQTIGERTQQGITTRMMAGQKTALGRPLSDNEKELITMILPKQPGETDKEMTARIATQLTAALSHPVSQKEVGDTIKRATNAVGMAVNEEYRQFRENARAQGWRGRIPEVFIRPPRWSTINLAHGKVTFRIPLVAGLSTYGEAIERIKYPRMGRVQQATRRTARQDFLNIVGNNRTGNWARTTEETTDTIGKVPILGRILEAPGIAATGTLMILARLQSLKGEKASEPPTPPPRPNPGGQPRPSATTPPKPGQEGTNPKIKTPPNPPITSKPKEEEHPSITPPPKPKPEEPEEQQKKKDADIKEQKEKEKLKEESKPESEEAKPEEEKTEEPEEQQKKKDADIKEQKEKEKLKEESKPKPEEPTPP